MFFICFHLFSCFVAKTTVNEVLNDDVYRDFLPSRLSEHGRVSQVCDIDGYKGYHEEVTVFRSGGDKTSRPVCAFIRI